MKSSIQEEYPISASEYFELNEKFGKLCEYQAWQLYKKNSRNNHNLDQEDIAQDLRLALVEAGSYFKRQVYIESCLQLCQSYVKDDFMRDLVNQLLHLWENKTRHGANRQMFGPLQEKILDKLTCQLVPKDERPSKCKKLEITPKFSTYCKAITWNRLKCIGKKITREKPLRKGQVSLSEFDYLVSC